MLKRSVEIGTLNALRENTEACYNYIHIKNVKKRTTAFNAFKVCKYNTLRFAVTLDASDSSNFTSRYCNIYTTNKSIRRISISLFTCTFANARLSYSVRRKL